MGVRRPVAAISFGLRRGLGSGCAVLRTASASISYSSAFVFFGSRVDFHGVIYWVINSIWG